MEICRRTALKSLTEAAHARLDAAASSGDPFENVDKYSAMLLALYGGHVAVESGLRAHATLTPLIGARSDLIAQDLSALNVDIPSAGSAVVYDCLSAAWGGLYVVAGAALGARTLVLGSRRLGLAATNGAAFFEHEAREGLLRLRAFLPALENAPDFDLNAASRGAALTFERFQAGFTSVREPEHA